MTNVVFTPQAKRELNKLSPEIRNRIIKKLTYFTSQMDPLIFAKPLVNLPPATHRFRVGDYRVAFYISEKTLVIERIKHRREVYQQ